MTQVWCLPPAFVLLLTDACYRYAGQFVYLDLQEGHPAMALAREWGLTTQRPLLRMFRGERPTFEGKHFRVKDAINSPAPITPGGPPIMIGGQGEKKTLRFMAQYADMANFTSGYDELPHKLEVLAQHCDAVGRDINTINKTPLGSIILGDTMEEAEGKRSRLLQERGLPPWDQLDDGTKAMIGARFVVGDTDSAGEQLQKMLALGIDGFTFNMPADGWELDAVQRAGQLVRKAVS